MEAMIHPTAVVSPTAAIGSGVHIGPGCVVGDRVVLGDGCTLHGSVYIQGDTTIGERNEFFPFSSIGYAPQDPKYKGEATKVEIGDQNIFRESVTVNAGTVGGGGVTRVGSGNLFMAYSHIGHDSHVGNNNVFVNHVSLSGHTHVQDFVVLSGYVGVTQFIRIGSHAMIGAGCIVSKDIPPFVRGKAKANNRVAIQAINKVGLERRGFSEEEINRLDDAFRLVFLKNLVLKDALMQIRERFQNDDHVLSFVRFIESSEKGIAR